VGAAHVVPALDLAPGAKGQALRSGVVHGLRCPGRRLGDTRGGDGAAVAALLGGHLGDSEGDDQHADDSEQQDRDRCD
jgi:hypothetical protein